MPTSELPDIGKVFFLSYLSRSGSTLLSRLLQENYCVCVTQEGSVPAEMVGVNGFDFLHLKDKREVRVYLNSILHSSKIENWGLNLDELVDRIQVPTTSQLIFLSILAAYRDMRAPSDQIIVYKGDPVMPWQVKSALENNSGARAIYIVRDPRAVLNSQENSRYSYQGGRFSFSPAHTAWEWRRMAKAIREAGNREHIVFYEDLICRTEDTLEKLANFMGADLRSDPVTGSFVESIAPAEKHLHSKVSSEPDQKSVTAWRDTLSSTSWGLMEYFARDEMHALGYFAELNEAPSFASRIRSVTAFRFGRANFNMRRQLNVLMRDPNYFFRKIWNLARVKLGG